MNICSILVNPSHAPAEAIDVATIPYAELHAHTNFSFLDGASHPEELIARAAQLGIPSLAITDHAGLYAAVRAWKAAQETETDAAREAGLSSVRPIIGLELAIPRTDDELRLARRGRAAQAARGKARPALSRGA